MSNEGQLVYSGDPIDLATSPISIESGWNWFAYLPQDTLDVNTALSSLTWITENPQTGIYDYLVGSATYIKDASGFADFIPGFGWWGSLQELRPTNGYVLNASESATLIYPESSELMGSSGESGLTRNIDPHWNHDYSEDEHNGSIMIAIESDNLDIQENDQIGAFHDNQVHGTAFAIKCPINDKLVFPMMIHSNDNDIEITFKYHDGKNDKEIDLQQKITYVHDMHLNDALNPYVLSDEMPLTYSLSDAYPNPFNPVTTINYSIADDINDLSIKIYDIRGRLVTSLHNGSMDRGNHQIIWNASESASGVYFIQMKASEHVFNKKIMLIK